MFENLLERHFDVRALHHAEAILTHDMPEAIAEIEAVLLDLVIPIEELVRGGGGEAQSTQRMRHRLVGLGWVKQNVRIRKFINDVEKQSLSHEIDHVKSFNDSIFALEIEWNNKDPFFDRDLESFKRLHAEGAISVGGVITRGQSFQDNIRTMLEEFVRTRKISAIEDLDEYDYSPTRRQRGMIERKIEGGKSFADSWIDVFVSDKFGEATTHWRKLEDRVQRGVGNSCPLVLIGIPDTVVAF